jgi:hypothetical protein
VLEEQREFMQVDTLYDRVLAMPYRLWVRA